VSRWRLAALVLAGPVFAAEVIWGLSGLPGFGHYAHAYGRLAAEQALLRRHVTNVPTAVNFDLRAIDTLAEEFILFSSALAMVLIVRSGREPEGRPPETVSDAFPQAGPGEATRLLAALLVAPALVLGGYVVVHGHLTPGGGFQGGVILASGVLLADVCGASVLTKRLRPLAALEWLESTGAAGYALVGVGGLIAGGAFFHNWLPSGTVSHLLSGGVIPVANVAVSLEVASAFLLVWSELRDRSLVLLDDEEPGP
jgi:multicomponent Na+:H+ antiporter subunit B